MFGLRKEVLQFLRIFQFTGFLPFKLAESDSHVGGVAFAVNVIILVTLLGPIFYDDLSAYLSILSAWDIGMLLSSHLLTLRHRKIYEKFFKAVGKIDRMIVDDLKMGQKLQELNVKTHRVFVILWTFFIGCALYYPIMSQLTNGFSYIPMYRALIWTLLINLNIIKFLYFYAIIAVRLDVIRKCLSDMSCDKANNNIKFVKELFADNAKISRLSKIIALRQIYHCVWLLQSLCYEFAGVFFIFYFASYWGQTILIISIIIKPAILNGTLEENIFMIILFICILNLFTVITFFLSYTIFNRGSIIAGLIHDIAKSDDQLTKEAIKMFSLQTIQQPMTTINILGLYNYDRLSINAVSKLVTMKPCAVRVRLDFSLAF